MRRKTEAGLIAVCTMLFACSTTPGGGYARQSDKAAKSTPPFDAAWAEDAEWAHAALFFDVEDGRLTLSDRPAERRPGSLPCRVRLGGPVTIVFLDGDGVEIGRYGSEHPATSRACASEAAQRVIPLARGAVEVLLPADPAISTVRIESGDRARDFDVRAQIRGMR